MRAKQNAIVVGGGIAGLLAARVLANHYEQVTVIERDHYPDEPTFRPGVPQSRQLHVLLLRGQDILQQMFPHLREHLLKKGALRHDYGLQSLYYYRARCQVSQQLDGWLCSRVLLEWQIRQELLTFSRIRFLEGYEVIGLLHKACTSSVVGIQYRTRDHNDATIRELVADLVIDASGVLSHAPEWLKGIGYEPPEETIVDVSLGYATRFYMSPAHRRNNHYQFISIQSTGTQGKRAGTLIELEERCLAVVLAGVHGDYPPQEDDEYLAFAKSLPDPALYEIIKDLKPKTSVYRYRRTGNQWRHYEQMKHFPENFLVLGDAFCSFNPVYGQGMTVAALEALALDTSLRSRRPALSRRFHCAIARVARMPWRLATMVDASSGDSPSDTESTKNTRSIAHQYIDRVTMLLSVDAHVLLTFVKVVHMLKSPLALIHPSMLLRVLFRHSRERSQSL